MGSVFVSVLSYAGKLFWISAVARQFSFFNQHNRYSVLNREFWAALYAHEIIIFQSQFTFAHRASKDF